MHRHTAPTPPDLDDEWVRITLDIPRDLWDLLHEATAIDQDWREVALKALEVGLDQATAPTNAIARRQDPSDE